MAILNGVHTRKDNKGVSEGTSYENKLEKCVEKPSHL